MNEIKHIVMFSGGACSWAAAKRVVERHGIDGVVLLFADTLMEDEDLYRFIVEAAGNILKTDVSSMVPKNVPPIEEIDERRRYLKTVFLGLSAICPGFHYICNGLTPWGIFEKERMIGSNRFDPCSKNLKRILLDRWHRKNGDPASTVLHFGLDWTECHRLERLRSRKAPWKVEAYMTEMPLMDKKQMIEWLKLNGIKPPRLYAMGFAHNNCGGFCVKSGQAQFALLLRTMPERYRFHEEQEERLRKLLGWRHTIIRITEDGKTKGVSLKEFRERIEAQGTFDRHEWGGCGCAVE